MKKRLAVLFSAAVVLASCGTAAQYASSGQKFPDGIYCRPEKIITQTVSDEEVASLVDRTEETRLFLFGDKKDTLVIPEDKSAIIRLNDGDGTSVTITADPFTEIYYDTWPRTCWRPVTFAGTWWDPWYYGRYWGYYSPWYQSAWYYDPWYWGYSSIWWDPWFGNPYFWGAPHLPYHPHWHHPHHGHGPGLVIDRQPDRYFGHRTSSGSSVRSTNGPRGGQTGTLSGTSSARRGAATASGGTRAAVSRTRQPGTSAVATRGSTSGITAVRRTPSTPANTAISGSSSSAGATRHSAVASSYRRKSSAGSSAGIITPVSDGSARTAVNSVRRSASRGTSSSYSRPVYGRGSSTSYDSGSSSFSRSSSSVSRSSSSFSRSSSSFSRSSSGHSGGSSRSGGSYRR